jgi:hypothetical protein
MVTGAVRVPNAFAFTFLHNMPNCPSGLSLTATNFLVYLKVLLYDLNTVPIFGYSVKKEVMSSNLKV